MNTTEKPLESQDVDTAKNFTLSGYNGAAVRATFQGRDGGFCTTSYSYAMSAEAKHYAAVRVALLLQMASGLSNEQLRDMTLIPTKPQVKA